MARTPRNASLESRTARDKIRDSQRHWVGIGKGLALGYRRGTTGGTWYVRQLVEGVHRYKAIGLADDTRDADGEAVLDYFQAAEAARKRAGLKTEKLARYTVSDALDDYLKWFKVHRKSYRDTELTVETHIRPAFGKKRIEDLMSKAIREWHEGLVKGETPEAARASKATANRVLTVLKATLNHAWREGHIESNGAWARVKAFHAVDNPKVRYLTAGEAKRLVNAADPDFRELVQAALLTGCRYGELIRLEVGDYNPDAGAIHVRDSKAGKPRHVPLTDEGTQFFERIAAGRAATEVMFDHASIEWVPGAEGEKMQPKPIRVPWGESHQGRPMREACARAKITPPISFHDLRHTYASLLAMAGTPLQVIARALGHADTRMTERHYAHLSPDHVAEQIRANLPKFGIKDDWKVRPIR